MPRASVIIASHNEGQLLRKTVQAVIESCPTLDLQIVVADDQSTDGSVDQVARAFPQVDLVQHQQRLGPSPTKALGADASRGHALVFLDAHVKPEPGAIDLLVSHVENTDGHAIITPRLANLDTNLWKNDDSRVGSGFTHDLLSFDALWLRESEMRPAMRKGCRYFESPGLIGCAFAVGRPLYEKLRGFDRGMRSWGVEDLDFGLKSWLMGHPILHAPDVIVAHRFRQTFDQYSVPEQDVVFNKLLMARKAFTEPVWLAWLEFLQADCSKILAPECPEGVWTAAWHLFEQEKSTVERERNYLHASRRFDEFWFADRFGLSWPRIPLVNPAASLRSDH